MARFRARFRAQSFFSPTDRATGRKVVRSARQINNARVFSVAPLSSRRNSSELGQKRKKRKKKSSSRVSFQRQRFLRKRSLGNSIDRTFSLTDERDSVTVFPRNFEHRRKPISFSRAKTLARFPFPSASVSAIRKRSVELRNRTFSFLRDENRFVRFNRNPRDSTASRLVSDS